MRPDERLNQIELVLADVVRTQGDIVFQIGKIVDYVTDTHERGVIQRI